MIWLSWRQQRIETLITAAFLVVLAAAFVPAGIHAADLFTRLAGDRLLDGLGQILVRHRSGGWCGFGNDYFAHGFSLRVRRSAS